MDADRVIRLLKKSEIKDNSGMDGNADFCEALEELVSDAPKQPWEESVKTERKNYALAFSVPPSDGREWFLDGIKRAGVACEEVEKKMHISEDEACEFLCRAYVLLNVFTGAYAGSHDPREPESDALTNKCKYAEAVGEEVVKYLSKKENHPLEGSFDGDWTAYIKELYRMVDAVSACAKEAIKQNDISGYEKYSFVFFSPIIHIANVLGNYFKVLNNYGQLTKASAH